MSPPGPRSPVIPDGSVLRSTGPSVLTGQRGPGGDIPSSDFLVPNNGVDVGARI